MMHCIACGMHSFACVILICVACMVAQAQPPRDGSLGIGSLKGDSSHE